MCALCLGHEKIKTPQIWFLFHLHHLCEKIEVKIANLSYFDLVLNLLQGLELEGKVTWKESDSLEVTGRETTYTGLKDS